MKIKIPIREVQEEDFCSKVEKALGEDKENAYTVNGLMIEIFKVKKEDIENKAFKDIKKELVALYSKITRCLRRLESLGKVKSKKHGKAFVYWYIGEYNRFRIKVK